MVYISIDGVMEIGGVNAVTYGISLVYICLGLYSNLDIVTLLITNTNPSGIDSAKEDQQYV